ncbi:hypothetical protein EG329_014063 [Mollisiaceae sp. DMI_Dod_QoI]|nr:hypothetical protein EG329_014063 [Helotiales sp. DMI_Dod_QoI]
MPRQLPWNIFTNSFSHCPGFDIYEHTRADIEKYTFSRLWQTITRRLDSDAMDRLLVLRDAVTIKAQGVFIWVRVVVDELVQDIIDGTALEELKDLVERIPEELKDLYRRTLTRIQSDYRDKSYIMMQIALCSLKPLPLETFINCVSYRIDKTISFSSLQDDVGSGGLLEAVPGDEEDAIEILDKEESEASINLEAPEILSEDEPGVFIRVISPEISDKDELGAYVSFETVRRQK